MTGNPDTSSIEVIRDEAPAVSDQVVDEVVRGIIAAQDKHGIALACEVGALIVEKFYGGDVGVLRERGPKEASLRRLAEHEALPMSPATLYRTVAIYELVERLGGVATWKHLGPSHLRAVLALPAPDQEKLLKRAEDRAWTVQKLETEAAKVRDKTKRSSGGRPPLPRFVKSIRALRKYAEAGDELFGDLDAVEELETEDAEALLETVAALQRKCDELQKRLRAKASL